MRGEVSRGPEEVAQRVSRGRLLVVVRSVDDEPGHVAERGEGRADTGQPVAVSQVVAGVDDEVGSQLRQACHPLLLAVLPRRHVSVGHVQDAEGLGTLRQHTEGVIAHREQVALDPDSPDRGSDGRRPRDPEGREGGGHEGARHGHSFAATARVTVTLLFAALPPAGLVLVTWPSAGALASR